MRYELKGEYFFKGIQYERMVEATKQGEASRDITLAMIDTELSTFVDDLRMKGKAVDAAIDLGRKKFIEGKRQ